MIRARFHANEQDPRPVKWPIKHPYWITGWGDGYSIVVAYADNEDEILRNWPEANQIEAESVEEYHFSERFPRPGWLPTVTVPGLNSAVCPLLRDGETGEMQEYSALRHWMDRAEKAKAERDVLHKELAQAKEDSYG